MISNELTVDGSEKGAEHALETLSHRRLGTPPPQDLGGFPHTFLEPDPPELSIYSGAWSGQ